MSNIKPNEEVQLSIFAPQIIVILGLGGLVYAFFWAGTPTTFFVAFSLSCVAILGALTLRAVHVLRTRQNPRN